MMLSKFAHKILITREKYIIFNSILFEPIILSKDMVKRIWACQFDNFSSSELNLLYRCGILVKDKKQDKDAELFLKKSINSLRNKISLLYIIPYGGCNLGCRYCFIGHINNKKAQHISFETIDNVLDQFADHLRTTKQSSGQVIFYGGEPTMFFQAVRYMVQQAVQKKVPLKFSMITNATLLTDEIIQFSKKYDISLGISLDGPKYENDFNRYFKANTKSVYDVVMRSIEKLKENGVNFGLSVTLSEAVLNNVFFLKWLRDINVKNINFNLLHFTTPNNNWKEYYKKASRFLFQAYDELSKLGVQDDRILRKIKAFSSDSLKYNDCNAVGAQQLTIRPNGEITVCHGYWNSERETIGNINSSCFSDIFKTETYQKWRHNLTVNKKKCLKCPALYICGRGCPKQAEDLFGSQQEIDKPFCIHTKYALKELLKRAFKESGSLN